jgi:hypothetical protein
MRLRVRHALGILLLALILGGALVLHRSERIRRVWREARNGESKGLVISRPGSPWQQSRCGQTLGGTFPRACSQEVIYRHPLAPLLPEYWSFQYNAEGALIGTCHYLSP